VPGLEEFFATLQLTDERLFSDDVIEALQEVLNIEFDAAEAWLRDVRVHAHLAPAAPTPSHRDAGDSQMGFVEASAFDDVADDKTDHHTAEALAEMKRTILAALASVDAALRFHRTNANDTPLTPDTTSELITLIRLGAHRTSTFSLLASSDIERAKTVLRDVMFNPDSDPERWPESYSEAMRQLLPTLVRYGGVEGFERFMRTLTLPPGRMEDPRIVCGIGKALGLKYDDAESWLRRVRQ
jgi:hypothetical protein